MRIPWIRRIKEGEGEPQSLIADLSCEVKYDYSCNLNRALSLKIEKLPDILKYPSGMLGIHILPELGITVHWVREDSEGLAYFI